MNEIYNTIRVSVINGDIETTKDMTLSALNNALAPGDILYQGLIPAMDEVGKLFEAGDIFVPEMLVSAHAMKGGMDLLKPHLISSGVEPVGRVAIGSIQGDLHDIGKNLVSMMLEGAGFEIVDLGTDVPAESFLNEAKAGADLLCISALLTTTMPNMKSVITALVEAGIRKDVKVLIGGAPITADFAQEIGADGYAPDASQATTLAKSLIG